MFLNWVRRYASSVAIVSCVYLPTYYHETAPMAPLPWKRSIVIMLAKGQDLKIPKQLEKKTGTRQQYLQKRNSQHSLNRPPPWRHSTTFVLPLALKTPACCAFTNLSKPSYVFPSYYVRTRGFRISSGAQIRCMSTAPQTESFQCHSKPPNQQKKASECRGKCLED